MSSGLVIGLLFVGAYGLVLVVAVRHRLLARLAVREVVRRRGQSLLIVGGLMVGTAAITASLIAGDSMQRVAVVGVYQSLGAVDAGVGAGGQPFPVSVARAITDDPEVGASVEGAQASMELVGAVANLDRERRRSDVRLVGFDPDAQAPFGAYVLTDGTRTYGETLEANDVLISEALATDLDARPGDRIRISVDGMPGGALEADIAGVAQMQGPGAYGGGRGAVFVPLETMWGVMGAEVVNSVRLTATGEIFGGVEEMRLAAPALERAVAGVDSPVPLSVTELKGPAVERAEEGTQFFRTLLLGLAVVVVAAGLTLVVNLAVMLAEERRRQLGVLRALGLRRRGVVRLSMLEGAIYSAVAAIVGVIAGVFVGQFVGGRLLAAFTQFGGGQEATFALAVHPATLAVAFAAGALVTLGTVVVTARRTSRMTITAAVRDLPEPPGERHRHWPLRIGGVVLAALGVVAVLQAAAPVRVLGGILLIGVTAAIFRDRMPVRAHTTLTGVALTAWAVAMVGAGAGSDAQGVFFGVMILSTLTAVFGIAFVVAGNLRLVEGAVGAVARHGRVRTTLRPVLGYLTRRPLRTGLSVGAFALALCVVTILASWLGMLRSWMEADLAGADVVVLSFGAADIDLPDDIRPEIASELAFPVRSYLGPVEAQWGGGEQRFVPLLGLTEEHLADPPFGFSSHADTYPDEEAAWAAVRTEGDVVLATGLGDPGAEIVLQGAEGPVAFVRAGSPQAPLPGTVVMVPARQLGAFDDHSHGKVWMLSLRDGADAEAVVGAVERGLFEHGVEAFTTESVAEAAATGQRSIFSALQVFVRLAILVGILTLGILAFRATVERRKVIGVLRAIGFRERQILAGLVIETGLLTTIGVVVGLTAGLLMSYFVMQEAPVDAPFTLDAGILLGSLLLVYVATPLVTIGPAWRASRLPPAEAARHTE